MSIDTVDDLHAAEDHAGALAHHLRALLAASYNTSTLTEAMRLNARAILDTHSGYCRPSCGWLDCADDERACLSGGEDDGCGCPCGHPAVQCARCAREIERDDLGLGWRDETADNPDGGQDLVYCTDQDETHDGLRHTLTLD